MDSTDKLYRSYESRLRATTTQKKRTLFHGIDWDNRLIGLKGARGAGKTTLLLQHIKEELPLDERTLYVSLDHLFFTENKLVDFVENFVAQGGQYLFLDEVHRYPNWSLELKNIYDDYADLNIVFTGSSMMHLHEAKADLSRRAVMYELPGLSFREFLDFSEDLQLPVVHLQDLLDNHQAIARSLTEQFRPLQFFHRYLQYGYYPYFRENVNLYPQKLMETVNTILEVDLPAMRQISYTTIDKIKLLLHIIAESVPFKPNISKLSERVGVTRNTLVEYLQYLEDARIIKKLYTSTHGISRMQKPEKIYLDHPNLHYAMAFENQNTGNIRESFFANQVGHLFSLTYPKSGDFLVDSKYLFEIGGKKKGTAQLQGQDNAFIAADDIEIGRKEKIPLWLFGFLS